jgi:oligosaccharide repeat unit polymerase
MKAIKNTAIQDSSHFLSSLLVSPTWSPITFLSMILFSFININIYVNHTSGYHAADISFLIVLFLVLLMFTYLLSSTEQSLFLCVFFVFFYLFFWLAPVLQSKNLYFPNTMPFDERLVIKTNALVFLFGVSVFFFRFLLKKNTSKIFLFTTPFRWPSKKVFYIYFFFSLIVLLVFGPNLFSITTLRQANLEISTQSVGLILSKFVYNIPLFLVYYLLLEPSITKGRQKWWFLFFALLIVLLFKNPFTEKRNALGPIYLSFFFIYYKEKFKGNLGYLTVLLFSLAVLFPLVTAITHTKVVLSEVSLISLIFNMDLKQHFYQLHYDAWSQVMATIKYVEVFGPTLGNQLLGALLFFVPRSIWPTKPVGSGHFIVEKFLSVEYSLYHSNVSCPFLSEGYINFGVLGVVLFTLILAFLSLICDLYESKKDFRLVFSLYTSFHMFFMLRGDLMSSFSYLIATLTAIYFLPNILEKSITRMGYICGSLTKKHGSI